MKGLLQVTITGTALLLLLALFCFYSSTAYKGHFPSATGINYNPRIFVICLELCKLA